MFPSSLLCRLLPDSSLHFSVQCYYFFLPFLLVCLSKHDSANEIAKAEKSHFLFLHSCILFYHPSPKCTLHWANWRKVDDDEEEEEESFVYSFSPRWNLRWNLRGKRWHFNCRNNIYNSACLPAQSWCVLLGEDELGCYCCSVAVILSD